MSGELSLCCDAPVAFADKPNARARCSACLFPFVTDDSPSAARGAKP